MVAVWHPLPVTGGLNLSGFVPPTAWNLVQVDVRLIRHLFLGFVNAWNQNYQTCRLSLCSVHEICGKIRRQTSFLFVLKIIGCGHAWVRAFHFPDLLGQPEAFNAPVARGRNMCCVAHWARWEKSLKWSKCLKSGHTAWWRVETSLSIVRRYLASSFSFQAVVSSLWHSLNGFSLPKCVGKSCLCWYVDPLCYLSLSLSVSYSGPFLWEVVVGKLLAIMTCWHPPHWKALLWTCNSRRNAGNLVLK